MSQHDLLIKNGTLVDGSGAAPREGDVAIRDGRIAAVGSDLGPARREIDAAGHLVTPGWVDIHTHYDAQATWDPYLSPSSCHGVTTVVMGNCGVGFAPVRPELTRSRAHRPDGGRGGHPGLRHARGHRVGLGEPSRSTWTPWSGATTPSTTACRCPTARCAPT